MMEEIKAERLKNRGGGGTGGGAGGGGSETAAGDASSEGKKQEGPKLSERAQKLISKGLLPIERSTSFAPVTIPERKKPPGRAGTTTATTTTDGARRREAPLAGAQDRERTGKSLPQRLEKAQRLAFDCVPICRRPNVHRSWCHRLRCRG